MATRVSPTRKRHLDMDESNVPSRRSSRTKKAPTRLGQENEGPSLVRRRRSANRGSGSRETAEETEVNNNIEKELAVAGPSGTRRGGSGVGRGRRSADRGRGGIRGPGRGNVRYQGKSVPGLPQLDIERVRQLQADRKQGIEEAISCMSKDELKGLVQEVLEVQPGLLFDVWERVYTNPNGSSSPTPHDSTNAPSWCKCSRCREMGNDIENKCCGLQPQNCVSVAPALDLLVLDPHVLQMANFHVAQVIFADIGYNNKARRHAAYRQFTLWRHGHLGAGIRLVIPSCVVLRIREAYPSPNAQYTGFSAQRLA